MSQGAMLVLPLWLPRKRLQQELFVIRAGRLVSENPVLLARTTRARSGVRYGADSEDRKTGKQTDMKIVVSGPKSAAMVAKHEVP